MLEISESLCCACAQDDTLFQWCSFAGDGSRFFGDENAAKGKNKAQTQHLVVVSAADTRQSNAHMGQTVYVKFAITRLFVKSAKFHLKNWQNAEILVIANKLLDLFYDKLYNVGCIHTRRYGNENI